MLVTSIFFFTNNVYVHLNASFIICGTFDLLLVNVLNLNRFKILLFGIELMTLRVRRTALENIT